MIGTTLGKYDVQEEIGRGGMAVVYRGYDRELEREVAIKILHPHLSSQKESKRRFHREARAVARLRFANILEIFDYSGKDSEETYIVTEFIHGVTLRRFMETHHDIPTEVCVLIALEICRGLRHAHENQVIHRDIKPENIMIRDDGVVKITDFGIAQMAGTTQMTMTGQILGSPAHMSPEHVENKPLDFRADIFSTGTLLYWMTTGRLPFEGRNPHAVIKQIVEGDYADPVRVRPAIGEQIARIIRCCLEVDPEKRYQSADELIDVLVEYLQDVDVSATGRELRRYFNDPTSYADEHQRKLLPLLILRGKEARRDKKVPEALNYFNRVLSIDETNEEVLTIVEGMTASNRLRRLLETSAVVVTVLAVLSGLAYGIWGRGDGAVESDAGRLAAVEADAVPVDATPQRSPRDAAPEPARDESASAEAGALSNSDAAVDMDASAASGGDASDIATKLRQLGPGPQIRRLSISPKRLVRIVPNPPAARVVIDGRDYGDYGAALAQGIPLTVGSHQVKLVPRDRLYEELEFQLFVPEGDSENELLVRRRNLPFRPALVRITTDVSGATVYVPHRERSRANRVFQVRMNAAREQVQMVVDADGYRSVVLDVELQAGQEYSRVVTLEPENSADRAIDAAAP